MSLIYTLNITPQTSPRPRFSKFGTYMPSSYKKYQEAMMWEMKRNKIPKADYSDIEIWAYFPYPKATPKKNLIEGAKMRVKPDWDNVGKTLTDCLEKLGLIENDSRISDGACRKRYTIEKEGRIEFKLII